MRTPDYILMKDYTISISPGDVITIPVGSFVRPIDAYYIPKGIRDKYGCRWFNEDSQVFCYTRFGILPIEKDAFRQV